jgi:hypothetical protein
LDVLTAFGQALSVKMEVCIRKKLRREKSIAITIPIMIKLNTTWRNKKMKKCELCGKEKENLKELECNSKTNYKMTYICEDCLNKPSDLLCTAYSGNLFIWGI